jgi:hypothetical protein
VIEVFQDQQTLFNDRMALVALDMGDETDAAGIVFIGGSYKPWAIMGSPLLI